MGATLARLKIAVIGGDARHIYLIKGFMALGAKVKVLGIPERDELIGCQFCKDIHQVIEEVDAIVLPMAGTDTEGNIVSAFSAEKIKLTEEIFQTIPDHVPIYLGVAKSFLKEWARFYNKKLIEIAELDDIAILNSIPTAEGAIQMAMEELPITIHGSHSVVVGFGRCGMTLARTLAALGAKTTVVARQSKDLARIKEMGFIPAQYHQLKSILPTADIIFNSIPVQVLDSKLLNFVNREALIIDIASAPGGTDFTTAKKLGIKAILAPSLPGRVAPKTAGLILAEVLPNLILQEISLSPNKEAGGKEE